ncbi:synthase [Musa troglodytarum]|uniref:Synthase n=1 Tax=Musa troglodytarum TaxID=320322 RepID=A0A9E7GSW9_9LILI|nr:synthase [Musa troglodytarum]
MEGSSESFLVGMIKEEVFSPTANMCSFLPPSAYETAWVAMIPCPHRPPRPMFPKCLNWILRNQREDGFWGECRHATDSLTATIACLVALKTWKVGNANIEQGLRFLNENMEKLLTEHHGSFPRWFAIVFPGMLELAHAKGLDVLPAEGCIKAVDDVFNKRNTILEMEQSSSGVQGYHPPSLFFLEALPESYRPKHELILDHQMEDGSLFHSPSATACAFIITGDTGFKEYLHGVVRRFGSFVPDMFPVDQDLIKLCLVDHLRQLGCGEHFANETHDLMDQIYSDWVIQDPQSCNIYDFPLQILKDSLAFKLLRMHGYDVSPRKFCRFMDVEEMLIYMEENYTQFLEAMTGVYRAAHFMFPTEVELHNAKLFSEKILQKSLSGSDTRNNAATMTDLQKQIEHELGLPWLARMDHLERRMYLERSKGYNLQMGKTSSCSLLDSKFAIQLAAELFTNRQMLYESELKELKKWSKDSGLSSMGFGREKTTYCYFLTATAVTLPLQSDLRKVAARCAILVTVIDDFFDEKGSEDELESLTKAVQRWEGEGLSGHCKVIFDALDNLVRDISFKALSQHGYDAKSLLQDMWRETFESWLKESDWSRKRHSPTVTEYLEVAAISIAIQVMTLPACFLVIPQVPMHILTSRYSAITKLTMITSRLLNDIHSYQKEIRGGKFNMVLLHVKENQGATDKDSIEHISKIIERKEREFLTIYMDDTYAGVPNEWKELHLATFKSFRMLFNATNAFDSPTALVQSINDAFYNPLVMDSRRTFSSKEETLLKPMERWSHPRKKYTDDDLLLKSGNRSERKDGIIPQNSRMLTMNINQRWSSKTWSSRRRSTISLMSPCINSRVLAKI